MRVTIFLVLGMLLMLSSIEEVKAYCDYNGCSIPGNLPPGYKSRFTPACNKHYVCYACGVLNGWSQDQCDTALKRDMRRLCQILRTRGSCLASAEDYYSKVHDSGRNHYKNPSLKWCKDCLRKSGDPNAALGHWKATRKMKKFETAEAVIE